MPVPTGRRAEPDGIDERVKRRRSGWSRANATLGDALSPLMKDRLHRLRDTLERQAREAVASQLAEARPPWRRHPEQRKITVLDKPNARRLLKPVPIPKKPTFEYWDFPSEAAAREPPPASNSHAERSHLEELLQAGTDSSTASGEELFVILGLDFGTSSTKAIVRLPYEAGEPTIAIPAPSPVVAAIIRICGRLCSGWRRRASSSPGRHLER